ncbi:MAG: hypothetical protein ACLTW9_16395 [Enterocloster sp.]
MRKRDGCMRPGQDLVMAGYAGFAGTVKIGAEKRDFLKTRFSPMFLRCLDETEPYSVEQWIKREQKEEHCSFTAYEYAGEGGVLAALWNLSGIFNAGIDADLRCMPVRQVTVEVCELFELNPYRLYCGKLRRPGVRQGRTAGEKAQGRRNSCGRYRKCGGGKCQTDTPRTGGRRFFRAAPARRTDKDNMRRFGSYVN